MDRRRYDRYQAVREGPGRTHAAAVPADIQGSIAAGVIAHQGELSGLRPVSMISQLSTAFPEENRVKIISGHVARSPVAESVQSGAR